jgi:hypothetical protein
MNHHLDPDEDGYDKLSDEFRMMITRAEWAWLSDAEKASFERRMTEPEHD